MKLDILTEIFLPDANGGALRIANLARNCAAQGIDVRVITKSRLLDQSRSAPSFEKKDGFRVYRQDTSPNLLSSFLNYLTHVDLPTFFAYYSSLRKMYLKNKPDALYVRQSFALQLAALLLRKEFSIPVFFEFHRFNSRSDFNLRKIGRLHFLFYHLLEKSLLSRTDGIIAISDVNKRELVADGMKDKEIVVVPNGVDVDVFSPPQIKKPETSQILYFGFIRPNEGVDTLMKAMPYLIEKIPDIKLVIVGTGPAMQSNIELSKSLGLEDHVDFRGEVTLKELLKCLHTVNLFVYPRRGIPYHKNFLGLKVLEALATGTPVVTGDIGILADFIRENKCGYLSKPDNPNSLSDTIVKALSDKQALAKMSKKAIASTKDMTWAKSSKKLTKALEQSI